MHLYSLLCDFKTDIMKWTKESKPKEGVSYYDHTILSTPIGTYIIEWKSWKDRPSYDIELDDAWLDCQYSLGDAKTVVESHLIKKYEELKKFIDSEQ
jgi:hypothetical protein